MERVTRKRKAQEMAEASSFVVERISELNAVLVERDLALVDEIKEQQDEIARLKKQLVDANEECHRWKGTAEFRHPDAVIDRIRTKLWHHGDLSILRRAIDPQMRVLRNTEARGDRSLYVCDSAPKKAGTKALVTDGQPPAMSPKHEYEEKEPAPIATGSALAPPTDILEEAEGQQLEAEEKEEDEEEAKGKEKQQEEEQEVDEEVKDKQQQEEKEEDDFVDVPPPAPMETQKKPLNDTMTPTLPVFNGASDRLMLTSGAS
ncbi:hypothetical protein P3T76_009474 [Phytophthora citrophthora]|uniref:Uncharacterized protein n=1 Tax=Phytophthora citrophthora TaxID=4793 RepID=A0AAD9GFY3_9STRA|nr:hypothetical protein P3T76_009474 [Phytophthora citrophthora]